MRLEGAASRTIILLTVLVLSSMLCWLDKVDAQAYVALVSAVLGGVIHASGNKQGADAATSPPPP
jgi:hypothetical protein